MQKRRKREKSFGKSQAHVEKLAFRRLLAGYASRMKYTSKLQRAIWTSSESTWGFSDLGPCDLFLFPRMKWQLRRCHVQYVGKVRELPLISLHAITKSAPAVCSSVAEGLYLMHKLERGVFWKERSSNATKFIFHYRLSSGNFWCGLVYGKVTNVRFSCCPQVTNPQPLNGFPLNLALESSDKTCRHVPIFVKTVQN